MGKEAPVEVLPPETPIPHGERPQPLPRPRFSGRRLALAFITAALADGLSVFLTLTPPVQWVADLVTAILLVRGAGLAMDLAARPDHGGDPRPLRFPVLGARGRGSGLVGDGAAKTDGLVKSPSAVLRFNFVVAAHRKCASLLILRALQRSF